MPLVRVRTGSAEETCIITSRSDTIGVIYLDSRKPRVDLSSGNRELLQTLALEASTILENARLLEEERIKQRMEEELIHRARDSDQSASAAIAVRWLVSRSGIEPSFARSRRRLFRCSPVLPEPGRWWSPTFPAKA